MAYIRIVAEGALSVGYPVAVYLASPIFAGETGSEAGNIAALTNIATVVRGRVSPTNWSVGVVLWRQLRSRGTDRVVVLDADRWLFGIMFAQLFARRRGKLRILIMRPVRQSRSLAAGFRFRLKRALASLVRAMVGPDSLAILTVAGTTWSRAWPQGTVLVKEHALVAPAGHSVASARAVFGIERGQVVIGMLGVLSLRKNPAVVLKACILLRELIGRPVTLLCVGPVHDASCNVLESAEINVVKRFGFVPDLEFSAAVSACDAIVCLYENEGSSGIVSLAAAQGVPVVAAGAQGVKTMVQQLGVGLSCELDATSVAGTLRDLFLHPNQHLSANTLGEPSDDHSFSLDRWALG